MMLPLKWRQIPVVKKVSSSIRKMSQQLNWPQIYSFFRIFILNSATSRKHMSRRLCSHESTNTFAPAPQGGGRFRCGGGGAPVRLLGSGGHSGAAGGVRRRRTGRCSHPSCALDGAVASHNAHAGCAQEASECPWSQVATVQGCGPSGDGPSRAGACKDAMDCPTVMDRALQRLDISCLREMLASLHDTCSTMQSLLFQEAAIAPCGAARQCTWSQLTAWAQPRSRIATLRNGAARSPLMRPKFTFSTLARSLWILAGRKKLWLDVGIQGNNISLIQFDWPSFTHVKHSHWSREPHLCCRSLPWMAGMQAYTWIPDTLACSQPCPHLRGAASVWPSGIEPLACPAGKSPSPLACCCTRLHRGRRPACLAKVLNPPGVGRPQGPQLCWRRRGGPPRHSRRLPPPPVPRCPPDGRPATAAVLPRAQKAAMEARRLGTDRSRRGGLRCGTASAS